MCHCNNLLQLNIVASHTISHKKKASKMEREVTELLMESRVHHQLPLSDGWVAIAEHYLELAKARFHATSQGSI